MSARPTLTRGPLPPEVYWRRRFFVITLALTIVFVIGSLLTGGSDGVDDGPVAQQAGVAEPTSTVTVPADGTKKAAKAKRRAKRAATSGPVLGPTAPITELADPDGPCRARDVLLTPVVEDGVAGRDITVGLKVQTRTAEACTFRVWKKSVAVKILDGSTEIWTSRECPGALPDQTVVVRRVIATVVEMTWNGLESDRACTDRADWVLPGDYTTVGSVLGSEPGESTFDLEAPTAETVEVTPEAPTKTEKTEKTKKRTESAKPRATDEATERPKKRTQDDPPRR